MFETDILRIRDQPKTPLWEEGSSSGSQLCGFPFGILEGPTDVYAPVGLLSRSTPLVDQFEGDDITRGRSCEGSKRVTCGSKTNGRWGHLDPVY